MKINLNNCSFENIKDYKNIVIIKDKETNLTIITKLTPLILDYNFDENKSINNIKNILKTININN